MRIGSNTLNNKKTISENKIVKGIQPLQNKNFNLDISDTFNNLSAWSPISGNWSTDGDTITTSTSSSSYPILQNFDLKAQDITATMSLTSAGPGIAFWIQDSQNWWAGITYYTTFSETYTVRVDTRTDCVDRGFCFGTDLNGAPWGCYSCSTTSTAVPGTRTRYNFYIQLIKSENGIVTDVTNVLLRSTCTASTQYSPCTISSVDNINGIQISTLGNLITFRGRDDSNNFYTTSISYTASNPNKGYGSGVIYAPGGNYLLNSSVQDITIVGA